MPFHGSFNNPFDTGPPPAQTPTGQASDPTAPRTGGGSNPAGALLGGLGGAGGLVSGTPDLSSAVGDTTLGPVDASSTFTINRGGGSSTLVLAAGLVLVVALFMRR